MRSRSFIYPALLTYELLRLCTLLWPDIRTGISALPVSWYASVPLLCLAPALVLMLAFDESQFALWLPLITLVKGLALPSLVLYEFRTLPDAVSFALSGDFSLAGTALLTLAIIAADIIIAVRCGSRGRKLCR